MQIKNTPGQGFNAQSVFAQAKASFQNGVPFEVSIPANPSGGGASETLKVQFQYGELEPAGDNALFTPGDPNAPDAGQQAFADALQNFFTLIQQDGQGGSSVPGTHAEVYNTSSSFSGGNIAIEWSGSFSLAPNPSTDITS